MTEIGSEQLEEGEIVDNDFEDISDNSIIEPTFGKFASSNDSLRALSLSSDSELDILKKIKRKRKLLHRIKRQRRRKKRRIVSESSDSDGTPPTELKGKLKEAVHISGIEEIHKNPLEIRLKAMGGLVMTNIEPSPKETNNQTTSATEKFDDNELENLRLEALKTAVLNKFQRRKRKKALLEAQAQIEPLEKQENKENNTPKNEPTNGEKPQTIDLEDDEDLLRASLLAGLAKKITKNVPINETRKIESKMRPFPVAPVLPKPIVKRFKTNLVNKQMRPKPQVKPLIINVNGDSDSEDEVRQNVPIQVPKPQPPDMKSIATNVDKFLKEQRAQFETKAKLDTISKKRFKLINKNTVLEKSAVKVLEKSAVKLLPKSQQIEYQQLLKKLRSAERKKRVVEKPVQKPKPEETKQVEIAVRPDESVEIAPVAAGTSSKIEIVVQPVTATAAESSVETKSDENDQPKEGGAEKSSSLTNELSTLQRTLKELKMQRNGSLQIKSKYQVLTPVIRKITATSGERKKQEQRIKTLLQELNEARKSLAKSHEIFSALVRELVSKKEHVDKRYQEMRANAANRANGKVMLNVKVKSTNATKPMPKKEVKPVTSTPIKAQILVTEEATISTLGTNSTNNDCEDMDVCNSDETDIYQIDIVDPNDIDQIFKRKPTKPNVIPEYVSPLNFNSHERFSNGDPHAIMCPYELNGSCRDNDCTYKHYLKSNGRLQ